jgi:AAA domain
MNCNQHVEVTDSSNRTLRVDKDVVLVREHFHLDHLDYRYMSPVIIPSGYTKRFVDGEINFDHQLSQVHAAMEHVQCASDITLIEGTGHCAVGSIVGLNNAKVASQLGADMVLMYVFTAIMSLYKNRRYSHVIDASQSEWWTWQGFRRARAQSSVMSAL